MIAKDLKHVQCLSLLCCFLMSCCSEADPTFEQQFHTISEDGAWCWFSDPRAIYVHGEETSILTGWVSADGDIEVARFAEGGRTKGHQVLSHQLDKDDHANPAFVELEDRSAMVFYAKHTDTVVRTHVAASDASFGALQTHDPFSDEMLEAFPVRRVTYANPYTLSEEPGKVFCFGRWTGYKPNLMISDDGGRSFDKSQVIISNFPFDRNNRPYVKYYSDGVSRIHLVFTDGHPRVEPTNSVYYAYYEGGGFYGADGSLIATMNNLPFEPKDATLVYEANAEMGKSWIHDIAADSSGPVILYARYPDDENHMYYYARYINSGWVHTEICNSGGWFPHTPDGAVEREKNYSGGATIDPTNCNRIYSSEEVEGVFEIIRYDMSRDGRSIAYRTPITTDSKFDNIRPYVPRNKKETDRTVVLWMQNERYLHYTDYRVKLLGYWD